MSEAKPCMAEAKSDRLKAIDGALSQIERQFGKGAIMRLGQRGRTWRSRRSPPARSRSTTRSASAASRAAASSRSSARSPRARPRWRCRSSARRRRRGGIAAFIDAEHALDADYAKKLGVDIDNLLVSQPDNGEQALEIAEMLVRCERASTSSSSTRWPRWCPRPSSRARWATRTSGCRRG